MFSIHFFYIHAFSLILSQSAKIPELSLLVKAFLYEITNLLSSPSRPAYLYDHVSFLNNVSCPC